MNGEILAKSAWFVMNPPAIKLRGALRAASRRTEPSKSEVMIGLQIRWSKGYIDTNELRNGVNFFFISTGTVEAPRR